MPIKPPTWDDIEEQPPTWNDVAEDKTPSWDDVDEGDGGSARKPLGTRTIEAFKSGDPTQMINAYSDIAGVAERLLGTGLMAGQFSKPPAFSESLTPNPQFKETAYANIMGPTEAAPGPAVNQFNPDFPLQSPGAQSKFEDQAAKQEIESEKMLAATPLPSPESVPSGRRMTKATGIPEPITVPASSVAKLGLGVGGYLTSPQGASETALSLTPLAPAVLLKWGYDMLKSAKDHFSDLKGIPSEMIHKYAADMMRAQIGEAPLPEDAKQDFLQRGADDLINIIALGVGGVKAGVHGVKGVAGIPETIRINGRESAPTSKTLTTKGEPNALVKEATQPVRNLREKPIESVQEVPGERNRVAPDERGSQEAGAQAKEVSPDSILEMSGEKYFETSSQWSKDSMAGKGISPQIQAEVSALNHPDITKWKAAEVKAISEVNAIRDEAKADPNLMGNPEFQKRWSGAAMKKQFFSEGREILDGTKKADQRSLDIFEKDNQTTEPTRAPEPATAEVAQEPTVESVTALDRATGNPIENPEPVGMGAMKAGELEPPKPFKTSNKNATVDAERKARGLPPMMELERQANQAAWDSAMRKIEEHPEIQDKLIEELTDKPRALTAEENSMLMQRRIDLRNEYEKSLQRWREAFESDEFQRAAEESQRVQDWSSKLSDLEDITKRTGAESGRSLQARRMMANEDYSLAAMETRAMQSKGRHLTPDEHIELIRAHEKISELERRLQEVEAGKEAKDVGTQTDETLKAVSEESPGESKSKDFDINREENLTSKIKAKIENGQLDEITPLVQQLARVFWRRGIRQREPMIDSLHEVLKTIIPDFSRDQTQRAFSGYGNFKPLSKEAIDVGLRDLRGQTQQVLKLEALEARKPLEKTGQERRIPTDEERRLIKQVNELKRKYGVVVTDPATQLKSALQSRKTYYEHRIADLKHEIETRQRIVKSKSPSPRDAELDSMIAEMERLKSEHDQIFPKREMTDEQRLKMAIAAAEKNQAHWEVRLNNAEKGVFDSRTPGRKVTSPELELIQAETAAIREHVKELHDLSDLVQQQKRSNALESQKKTLEKQIAEQERKLREGDLKSPGSQVNRPADPALEILKQKRDTLNNQLAEARKKPEAQKYAEAQARELERLNKAIDERQAKVAAGDISPSGSPKKINRPSSPELEQARQQLEAVNSQLADLRKQARPVKTKEQIALQTLKTRMANQIVKLRERIAKSDFTKKERKPVKLDEEANRIKAELDVTKEEFKKRLEQDQWAKMSVFGKAKRKLADTYDAARAIMTTGELSFILRQGKMSALSHPIQTAKTLPDTFRALVADPAKVKELELKTLNDPLAETARQDKLFLDEHGTNLSRSDEILMGHWVGNIPVVRNFNNAARVFLNKIRFDTWKAMRKSLSKSGTPTPEEGRQIAMFVNESTGRGGLGKLEAAAVPLARVMFSPRYYASRLQLASGHSLWGGTMRTRRIIATEYARSLIGLGLYYTMLSAFFASNKDKEKGKIETDPRSTDFGKIKIGDTRLDPLAGLSQVIVLGARTASGQKKTGTGKIQDIRGPKVQFGGDKWSDVMARHLRGKLHPVPSSIANLFDGTDLGGNEATVINQSKNMVAPITYMDIYAALKEQDLDDATALSLLALLGEGLQTYKKEAKK